MADFLDEKVAEIDRRLKEIRPLHDEYLRLERARAALAGLDPEEATARRPGRPRGAGTRAAAPRRRRRRQGGTRAEQALAVVRENPGITVSQLAERLQIGQANYLYRVMAELQSDGAVRKEGRGFVAV
jgi:hypothetical protein